MKNLNDKKDFCLIFPARILEHLKNVRFLIWTCCLTPLTGPNNLSVEQLECQYVFTSPKAFQRSISVFVSKFYSKIRKFSFSSIQFPSGLNYFSNFRSSIQFFGVILFVQQIYQKKIFVCRQFKKSSRYKILNFFLEAKPKPK